MYSDTTASHLRYFPRESTLVTLPNVYVGMFCHANLGYAFGMHLLHASVIVNMLCNFGINRYISTMYHT